MNTSPRTPGANHCATPVLLPPQIAPSEDLSWQAQRSRFPSPSPFDGDPFAERVFDFLARALHRREYPNALLVGERGVGKSTLIAELARRAVHNPTEPLAGKRFLAVDCRHTSPDEARARLTAVLGHTAPHADLVICLDGLHGLLRPAQGGSNKPVLDGNSTHSWC